MERLCGALEEKDWGERRATENNKRGSTDISEDDVSDKSIGRMNNKKILIRTDFWNETQRTNRELELSQPNDPDECDLPIGKPHSGSKLCRIRGDEDEGDIQSQRKNPSSTFTSIISNK